MGVMAKSVGSSFAPIGGTSGTVSVFSVSGSWAWATAATVPTEAHNIDNYDVSFRRGMIVQMLQCMASEIKDGLTTRFIDG